MIARADCWTVHRTWNSCVHKHSNGLAEVEKVYMQDAYLLRVGGRKVGEYATWRLARKAYAGGDTV